MRDKELSTSEKTGHWIGSGAVAVGLITASANQTLAARVVAEEDFTAVLSGYGPPSSSNGQAGRRLNGRYVPGVRRCAWDVVFSAHKSVSVAGLCLPGNYNQPRLIRDAFTRAVQDTFVFLETLARRANGYKPDVVTGSLLAASFQHETSRRNDPQLHQHLLITNVTRDTSGLGREWYALEPLQIYRQAREADMVFQRELHRHLRDTGMDARMMTVDGLPVAVLPAVDPQICRRLSQAHQAILERTAGRWSRENRNHYQMRWEQILNERLRPAKTGQLILRAEKFERALSAPEIAQITAEVQLPTSVMAEDPQRRPEPTRDVIKKACARAAMLVGRSIYSPREQTLAAWYASMLHLEQPFAPFRKAAAENTGWVLGTPTDPQVATTYATDQELAWTENEAYFSNRPTVASRTPVILPDTPLDPRHPSGRPSKKTQLLADEISLTPAVAQSPPKTIARSDQSREGVQISEYLLPSPLEELSDLTLGPSP